ncbi:MAG: hypothetical protein COA75_06590 [Cellvibrionales bacterium]|nr:MAG: hypothetical protein COA75_06590 [Cellvibrionales bacterium]
MIPAAGQVVNNSLVAPLSCAVEGVVGDATDGVGNVEPVVVQREAGGPLQLVDKGDMALGTAVVVAVDQPIHGTLTSALTMSPAGLVVSPRGPDILV